MVNKHKINLRDVFLGLQGQMALKLSSNRKNILHPGTKGDACELAWIEMLSQYLPSRYCADKAFVMDCDGNISQQIDVVVFDRHYSPFILRQSGATYIPAESVYAVLEVKQNLTGAHIDYAATKAESVRKLKRTSAKIIEASGKKYKPKKPFDILAGILTIDGGLGRDQINKLKKLSGNRFLNFGCSLQDSSFCFNASEAGMLFEKSRKGDGLIFFFLNALRELQHLGTVPAIDIASYVRPLNLQE